MLRRPFFWIIALVVAAFVVLPLIGNNVELRESLALAAVYITLASNLNLMLGYAGYINFGSIVFFGLGGYICVWLVDAHGWPLALSLAAAGIGVSALSLIFGFGILRLSRISNHGVARPAFIFRRKCSCRSAGRDRLCG
jgi:branched-chain amino acid transport system permease protein